MFDIGWTEMIVVAIVAILFVGPKELPTMLRTIGQMVRKVRGMVGEAKQTFNDAVREAELDGVQDSINQVRNLDPTKQIKDKLNPLKDALNDSGDTPDGDAEAKAAAEAAERKRKFEEIAAAAQSSGTSAVPGFNTSKSADVAPAAAKGAAKPKSAAKPKPTAKPKTAAAKTPAAKATAANTKAKSGAKPTPKTATASRAKSSAASKSQTKSKAAPKAPAKKTGAKA